MYFQIQGLYDVIMTHNVKHERPCNFAIFQDKKYKFGKVGYFDANFSKKLYICKFKVSMTLV